MKGKRASFLVQAGALGTVTAVLAIGAGCTPPQADTSLPPGALNDVNKYQKQVDEPLKADAGVQVEPPVGIDPTKFAALIHSKAFGSRANPFALLAVEASFDLSQNADRLIQAVPFSTDIEPPAEPVPEVIEPQPYRRLAGVMVGDSVAAIIDMGDGKSIIIHPGEQIPGTEWTVVSIDLEKAVLRRPGNKKPKEVVVKLAASLGGIIQPNGGNPTPGGNTPGGRPGGPGGGPPNGPSSSGSAGGGGGGSAGGAG